MSRQATSRRQRQTTGARTKSRRARVVPRTPIPPVHSFHLLFEHSLIGMYHTTLDGRILDCNESMARMLGYASRRELLHHKAADLYPAAGDRRAFLARLRRAGTLLNSELRLRRKDGGFVHVLENVALVRDAAGRGATIQGTMVDITTRKRAEEALRESEHRYRTAADELRRLTRHVEKAREAGRMRIARELHDELGQSLTALNMDLHWLRERAARKLDVPEARVAAMCVLASQTIHALRRICTDLRPALLDDLGLVAAIDWQAREFAARTGIRCTVSLPRAPLSVPRDQSTAVFRILQESLTNIVRHARATRVRVALRVRANLLTLKISDNGVGITRARGLGTRSLGLLGMRERAIEWNGEVDVRGAPGKGTTVTLRVPVEQREVEAAP